MRFKSGADILASDGKKVGRLKGVVMTPVTDSVTHLIVEHGIFFNNDSVIPMDWVSQANEDGEIRLSADSGALKNTPQFNQRDYLSPGTANTAESLQVGIPASFYYYGAPASFGSNAAVVGPAMVASAADMTRPDVVDDALMPEDDRVRVTIGAEVVSSDDERVGKIDEVIANAADSSLTHFVIAKGFLFTTRKLIPMHWVGRVEQDRVVLAVNRAFLERLPDYDDRDAWNTQGDEGVMPGVDNAMYDEDADAETEWENDPHQQIAPRMTDEADSVGVETSRSRDWERTGTYGTEATLPADGDDDPEYYRDKQRPVQGT
jgi:uncharacterized protein YrrD